MTELAITPKWKNKEAKFRGVVAAGEHVAVTIQNDDGSGNAFISDTETLRLNVIDPTSGRLLATFPTPVEDGETPETWSESGTQLSCELNLNTVQMLKAVLPASVASLLFVLDDYENKTLYFKAQHEVAHWPRRRGEEEPLNLDGYKDIIRVFGLRLTAVEETATSAAASAASAATSSATSAQAAAAAAAEVAKVVEMAPEAYDTLKEIADYIEEDKTGAAQMVRQIDANAKAISAEVKRAQDAETALAERIEELEENPSVEVVAPSPDGAGKAADAKAVDDALAGKRDYTDLSVKERGIPTGENGGVFVITRDEYVNGEHRTSTSTLEYIGEAWSSVAGFGFILKDSTDEEDGLYTFIVDGTFLGFDIGSDNNYTDVFSYSPEPNVSFTYTVTGYLRHDTLALTSQIHNSLSGVNGITEITLNNLAAKMNEIITKLGGTVAALLLCACSAFGATTAPLGTIPNTTHVVTSVTDIEADVENLKAESSLMYRLYSGSNAVMEVTNYNSRVNPPAMRLRQLDDDGQYITIWTETNGLARTLASATNHTTSAMQSEITRADNTYAPRAWSKTTSGLGAEAPSNTTWISTPQTVIAGGLEFQKVIISSGQLWFLRSNGANITTNKYGYLSFAAADGVDIISIEKTDSYLVGVDPSSVVVSGNTITMTVPVVSTEPPLLRYTPSLSLVAWEKQEDGFTSPITVTWSGVSGEWVCTVVSTATQGFFAFEFRQEGGTKIINNGVVELPQGILCTDGATVIKPVNNNGTITWVVQ